MAFDNWQTNPANNTLIDGINWSEGQLPSTVNGSARQMMADLANFRNFIYGSSSPFAMTTGGTFSGAIKRDNTYYIDLLTGNPLLNFDNNDYLTYNRAANTYDFVIATTTAMSVRNGETVFFGRATFTGDSEWYVAKQSANPVINFDNNDYLLYDRANNQYSFRIAGSDRLNIGASETLISSSLTLRATGSPSLSINSIGVVIAKLAAQNDGNTVFYRNAGGGDTPIWSVGNDLVLNVQRPTTFASTATAQSFNLRTGTFFGSDANTTYLSFDNNDFIGFDRSANQFYLVIGGVKVLSYDTTNGLRVAGNVTGNTTP